MMFEKTDNSLLKEPINKPKQATIKSLSRKELLEVSENISRYYAPKISSSAQNLVLLAIDPNHLYAYWNLVENQPDTISRYLSNNEWVLRIKEQHQKYPTNTKEKSVAEIKINKLHSGREIKLPTVKKGMTYSASIGRVVEKDGFDPLLKSNTTLPLYEKEILSEMDGSAPSKVSKSNNETLLEATHPHTFHYQSVNHSGKGKTKV
jgi:hypothetical protein